MTAAAAGTLITGFGRLGDWFAAQRLDVQPDLLVMAKGITSGYMPLGAVAVGSRVSEPFWHGPSAATFRHGMTCSGHASGCAAALANLDIIEREGLRSRAEHLSAVLHHEVQCLADLPAVTEVRSGLGLMAGVQLAALGMSDRVSRNLLERGQLVRSITDGTLPFSPPFVATPRSGSYFHGHASTSAADDDRAG
jgi:putrescine---pyruvate transaminase